ncbi:MAG: hypothetical protein NUV69_02570 [Candidatus Curtissbacteria bacterium]|nr:hypothetical protein [Candidatus Curtissbacteria bacterium]
MTEKDTERLGTVVSNSNDDAVKKAKYDSIRDEIQGIFPKPPIDAELSGVEILDPRTINGSHVPSTVKSSSLTTPEQVGDHESKKGLIIFADRAARLKAKRKAA